MADDPLAEFQAHLEALWAMPLDAAQALQQKLYERRRLIDGQLLVVGQVIARHKTEGGTPPAAWLQQPLPEPPAPGSNGAKPSRRVAFLTIMAQDPQRDWHLQEVKPQMVALGVVEDNAKGTDRVSAAAAETKRNKEAEHVGPSRYRITEKGLTVVNR